jgi:hypothetical protein
MVTYFGYFIVIIAWEEKAVKKEQAYINFARALHIDPKKRNKPFQIALETTQTAVYRWIT